MCLPMWDAELWRFHFTSVLDRHSFRASRKSWSSTGPSNHTLINDLSLPPCQIFSGMHCQARGAKVPVSMFVLLSSNYHYLMMRGVAQTFCRSLHRTAGSMQETGSKWCNDVFLARCPTVLCWQESWGTTNSMESLKFYWIYWFLNRTLRPVSR